MTNQYFFLNAFAQLKVLDLICCILLVLNNDGFTDEILKLTGLDDLMMNSYVRFKLISELNQPVLYLNELFEFTIINSR